MMFFNECKKDQDLYLPVLKYVYQKSLSLRGYTLSIGHANALAKAFEMFDHYINKVIFDNCGIDDQEFAAILNGIYKLKGFNKIVYRYNTFGKKSLEVISRILKKKPPNHLEEIRIENCKIEPTVTK